MYADDNRPTDAELSDMKDTLLAALDELLEKEGQ